VGGENIWTGLSPPGFGEAARTAWELLGGSADRLQPSWRQRFDGGPTSSVGQCAEDEARLAVSARVPGEAARPMTPQSRSNAPGRRQAA